MRGFLFDNIVSGSLLIGAPIAFISYLTEQMGATNLAWMSGLLFALFCFELIRSIKHFRKSRRLELPEQKDSIYENLQKIYAKLDEAGEVSAIRIRELVTKATKAGVIWSEQLVPLLDDIIKRTGQLGPDYQMASGSKLLAKPSAASEGAD